MQQTVLEPLFEFDKCHDHWHLTNLASDMLMDSNVEQSSNEAGSIPSSFFLVLCDVFVMFLLSTHNLLATKQNKPFCLGFSERLQLVCLTTARILISTKFVPHKYLLKSEDSDETKSCHCVLCLSWFSPTIFTLVGKMVTSKVLIADGLTSQVVLQVLISCVLPAMNDQLP